VGNLLAEAFQSHPMLIRRINKLRDYARTAEYQRMQAGVNGNVGQAAANPVEEAPKREAAPHKVETPPEPEAPPQSPEERWPWLKHKEE
jgi:hypothetical protein